MGMIGGWIAAGLVRLGLRPSPDLARGALRPGESTAAEVRRLLGEPEEVHEGGGGARTWEYPRGPAGTETWMVEIGPDDRYRGMRNVLVDDCFRQVERGASMADVRRLLGRPTSSAEFRRRGGRVLSWRYRADGGRLEHFNAHFDETGRLANVSRTPDPESINSQ
ncbi:MAG: hypothetical protein M9951_03195 [Burkholderiaceae bacterium]|jgi:hypothetical protein|nr:hypothetical protein [Burkholderiaceae bacterium]MEB2317734.1 hypothetical protein [Pseudomonadota bacterium]